MNSNTNELKILIQYFKTLKELSIKFELVDSKYDALEAKWYKCSITDFRVFEIADKIRRLIEDIQKSNPGCKFEEDLLDKILHKISLRFDFKEYMEYTFHSVIDVSEYNKRKLPVRNKLEETYVFNDIRALDMVKLDIV